MSGLRRDSNYLLFGLGIDQYSWRGVKWFFLTYFGAFLAAALVAPLVYLWIRGMEVPAGEDSVIAYLQGKPIDKYVDRFRLLFALVAMIWMISACGLWGRFGFAWGRNGLRTLGWSILWGVLTLGTVVLGQALFAGPVTEGTLGAGRVVEVVLAALAGGLIIGWLEEAIFRGMVLRMFATAMKPGLAVILSAAVFAAVHFKSVPDGLGEPFHWYSGFFVAAYQSISVFLTVEVLDFANLFLVGVVLNLVFLRTGSLIGCMGLHAGWVLVRNTWGELVDIPERTRIWGTESIVDGWASLILLAILVIALYANLRKHQKEGRVDLGPVS